jgi:hypothetical protein
MCVQAFPPYRLVSKRGAAVTLERALNVGRGRPEGHLETAVVNVAPCSWRASLLRAGAGGCARLSASARTTVADDLG